MNEKEIDDFFKNVSEEINLEVLGRIYATLIEDPDLREYLNPAFPFPKELRLGILGTCFVVEFVGPSDESDNPLNISGIYNPQIDVYEFLNIDKKQLSRCLVIPAPGDIENISFFLGESISYLTDYCYDFTQIPQNVMLNGHFDISNIAAPIFISNTTYFWSNDDGDLKIRHIDYLEIIPFDKDGNVVCRSIESLRLMGEFIVNYRVPHYKIQIHKQLNKFIELINEVDVTEPQITKYLADNPVILQIAFGMNELHPQCLLKWQYDKQKDDLKPDFLPERMDGYSDILEFKLPHLKSLPIVGIEERRHPSYEIDSALAQLDLYEEWCSQDINLKWLEKENGIIILNPQRYLVIGHSDEFSKEERAKLRKTRNTKIITYDEFIELARYQVYRVR